MFQRLKNIFSPHIETLNLVEIHATRLLDNLYYLDSLQAEDNALFPVLKSNAYGHGLKEVASILRDTPVPYICVDSFPEYQIVKDYAKKPSLIMWETIPSNYKYYDPRWAIPIVYNKETIQFLANSKKRFSIHLFLNTGMNREWVQEKDLRPLLDIIQQSKHLRLDGVMSHLAMVDMPDDTMTSKQIAKFKKMYHIIEEYGFSPKRKYIGNSAWMVKIFDNFFNAWRVWIAFYGYNHLDPEDKVWDAFDALQPALRITTQVISLQQIQKWETASYGKTFIAPRNMTIATLPFGYHEWLNRKLHDQWEIKWKDKQWKTYFLPLIWNICMNLSIFDTQWLDVEKGDKIELISWDKKDRNTLQHAATLLQTIPYEVLVNIDAKIRRKIEKL